MPKAAASPAEARCQSSASVAFVINHRVAAGARKVPDPLGNRRRCALGHVVHELEVGHRRRVALARADLDHARVAAGALREAGRHLGEEFVGDRLRAGERDRLTMRGDVAALAERDHLLHDRPHLLGLRLGRPDAAVLDQRARQAGMERPALGGVAPELPAGLAVPHSSLSVRPWAWSVSETSSIDFLPKLGMAASSFSLFETRSPIVSIPTRLRQLYERTPSSSSSMGKFSIPWACGASASASAAASRGETEPSVVTSSVSLS